MSFFDFFGKRKEVKKKRTEEGETKEWVVRITSEEINFFKKKAEEKIKAERWAGRNKEIKVKNFVDGWVTEEAFKKLLIKRGKWFRHRGLYVGDALGAGKDFEVRTGKGISSVGIRSISEESWKKWKSVAYPDDRFREEPEKIADLIIACCNVEGRVRFFGLIGKKELLEELKASPKLYSKVNQECFRVARLEKFSLRKMGEWMGELE